VSGPDVAFLIVGIVGSVAAFRMVTSRNVVRAALYLVLTLAMVGATYILTGAEFVGWVQVLIYVGAIVVLLLFALHHNPFEAQGKVLAEAVRLADRRVVVMEDTPTNRVDRAFNVLWDKVLNLRHGVPTPFAFRDADEWVGLFEEHGLQVRHVETYRPKWPTLGTYHHSLFVLDREQV